MSDSQLMSYFKFDEADLRANRKGQFSAKQKDRLFGRHISAVRQKRIASAILIPLSTLMLVWMIYLIYKNVVSGSGSDTGTIVLLGFFGALLLLAGSYILRLSFIGPTYLLKRVDGPINIVKESQMTDYGTAVRYELHVGGEIFNLHLDSTVGDVMTQGNTYAIYYSQGVQNNLREIFSAELISKAK
ncbi:MAG TPA: hypothetical protein VMT73_11515 [Anaerolineales bacterium]|nr:hypothetical protein [Anaerolineales bacterium]